MKNANLKIEYMPLDKLKGYHRNSRTHSDAQIDAIKSSIKQFGFNQPILIDETHTIVAGHGRYAAATALKLKQVPTIQLNHLTDAQRRAYVIADNTTADMGGWDTKMFDLEIADLQALGGEIDLAGIGVDAAEIEKAIENATEMMKEPELVDSEIKGLYDDAQFKGEGAYDFPLLRKDMILEIPKAISTWAGPDISSNFPKPYMWQWGSDSTVNIDWTQTIVGFYVDDERFECWWNDPRQYAARLVSQGVMGALTPNFSCYGDMPAVLRLYSTYRSRWVGRYMQEAGIKVIPDIECQFKDAEHTCAGLKGIPYLSTQIQQRMDPAEMVRQNQLYTYIIDTLKPEAMIVVCPEDRLKLFPCFSKTRVVRVEPRSLLRGSKARQRKLENQ